MSPTPTPGGERDRSIDPQTLCDAVARLREGRLVVFPTETVYGLGADALNPEAVRAIYDLKRRPTDNPLSLLVADAAMAEAAVASWPPRAAELARRFWPGPLTLVLPKSPNVPDIVTAGLATVGVRCPDHPCPLAIIRELGRPIVGTSANISGDPAPTTAHEARASLCDPDLLIIDGGRTTTGAESTILDLSTDPPRILRQGPIPPGKLGLGV